MKKLILTLALAISALTYSQGVDSLEIYHPQGKKLSVLKYREANQEELGKRLNTLDAIYRTGEYDVIFYKERKYIKVRYTKKNIKMETI